MDRPAHHPKFDGLRSELQVRLARLLADWRARWSPVASGIDPLTPRQRTSARIRQNREMVRALFKLRCIQAQKREAERAQLRQSMHLINGGRR